MYVRFLLRCLWLAGLCVATEWSLDARQREAGDLIPRILWAEQLSLSLLPAYTLASEPIDDPKQCISLLYEFANSTSNFSNCVVSMARPVRLCRHCYKEYVRLKETLSKIENPLQNSTISCSTILLHSDRVQVIVSLSEFFDMLWEESKCEYCLEKNNTGILNSTTYFMDLYDSLIQCFNSSLKETPTPSQQGNFSRLCHSCNESYRHLNNLYKSLEHANAICIDIEDAMNSTRKLWSKTFNCTLTCTDTVSVIAVSLFFSFTSVMFYLVACIHSEQKKRKLIFPKRFKSSASISNIQDKRDLSVSQ